MIAGAYQTGILGVRSLQRRGVEALCFDSDASMPGFRSAYGRARLCPDPDVQPEAWLQFMKALGGSFRTRPALIASADKFVTAIARFEKQLAEHFLVSPGVAMHALLADKLTQYDLAAKHGMPMSLTRFVKSVDEVREFAREAQFPCVLKPNHFREWHHFPAGHPYLNQKVAVVHSAAELVTAYELAASVTPQLIVQEVILGGDNNKRVYLSVYDGKSRRIANAMFRSLRCDPVQFGPATVTEPVVDPETDQACDNFLRSIGYVGICEIEMKRDSRDGKPKLIEANPRLSGGGDAGPYAGVDICWVHYQDLVGRQVQPVTPNGAHFKHVVLRSDGYAIPNYFGAGLIGFGDIWRSYRGKLAFFDIDWRDKRYSLETIYIFTRALARRLPGSLYRRMRRAFSRERPLQGTT